MRIGRKKVKKRERRAGFLKVPERGRGLLLMQLPREALPGGTMATRRMTVVHSPFSERGSLCEKPASGGF